MPSRSLYLYRGSAAKALSQLKYQKRLCMLGPLCDAMVVALGDPMIYRDVDIVVPVPASRYGFMKRGFNQSALMADFLGRYLDVPVERQILQRRGSKQQVGLGRFERRRNAQISFGPGRSFYRAAGKHVLLFDDVFTTGATVKTCESVLKDGGADVSIITFARRAPEHIEHLIVDRSIGSEHLFPIQSERGPVKVACDASRFPYDKRTRSDIPGF